MKSARFCLRYLGLCCHRLSGLTNVWIPLENKCWQAISAECQIVWCKSKTYPWRRRCDWWWWRADLSLPSSPNSQETFFTNRQIQTWQEFLRRRLLSLRLWCALTASHCGLWRPGHAMDRAILTRLPSKHCWDVKVPVNLTQRVIRQKSTESVVNSHQDNECWAQLHSSEILVF